MTLFILSGAITFAYIFLKAMQQLNVVHGHYGLVFPVSMGMGLCEVGIVLLVVKTDNWMLGLVNGMAGGLAAVLAMWIHKRFVKGAS